MQRICDYTVFDMEMTGLSPKTERVIEIGAVRIRNGQETACFSCLVDPGREVPERITALTGITTEMARAGMAQDEAMQAFLDFLGEDPAVGQNIRFDYSFLAQWCINKKKSITLRACDTLKLARILLPSEQSKKLEDLCLYFDVPRENAHRALDDARETGVIFEHLQDMLEMREDGQTLLKPELLVYKAKRQTPATRQQIKRLEEYRRRYSITETIDWQSLTRNEASRIHDRYIMTYGRL